MAKIIAKTELLKVDVQGNITDSTSAMGKEIWEYPKRKFVI